MNKKIDGIAYLRMRFPVRPSEQIDDIVSPIKASEIAEIIDDYVRYILESQLKIDWHKYPEEVPKDIGNKWVTIKDGTTDISWYNKKSQAENLHWDGFLDEDIIAWANITYPEPNKEEK